jgi:hypothetical protein
VRKIGYIIPGFTENGRSRKVYSDVAKEFKQKGIQPVHINIQWERTAISNWMDQFFKQFVHGENDLVYLFGFSYGAMIAFLVSSKIKIEAQILCSLSPYFREDLPKLRKSWKKAIGKRRIAEFEKLSFNTLARKVGAQTFILHGSKEGDICDKVAERAAQKLPRSTNLLVIDAPHDISHPAYGTMIMRVIRKL